MSRCTAFLFFLAIAVLVTGCGNGSDNREDDLLRKEAELAKKEAELAKKELDLVKNANSTNANAANSTQSEQARTVNPRRIKTPSGLNAFAENSDEEVLAIDLDGDGNDEYIGIIGLCGSGGCQMGIFQRTSRGFKDIFAGDDLLMPDPAPPPVRNWKPEYKFVGGPQEHNGYLDLSLVWKRGKTQRFRFDGVKYRLL